MAHIKNFFLISTKLSTQLCFLKQKDICIYKFQSKTKKTFIEFAFYYTNIHELLFSSIASNFYTPTFELIKDYKAKSIKKHFFDFDCLR